MDQAGGRFPRSGMTEEWCREHGISESTYYNRQQKIFEVVSANQEVCFTEVLVMQPIKSNSMAVALVQCGDISIDIYSGAGKETLKSIFGTLKSC